MNVNRRNFLAALGAGASAASFSDWAYSQETAAFPLKGQIKKTLKIGMIRDGKSLAEKFEIARSAGFDGVELNTPIGDIEEAKSAVKSTGFPVDGTVIGNHWQVRHTDPSADVRQKALDTLKQSIEDTKVVGGDTTLLVTGHGKDGEPSEIFKRAIENITPAVELAEQLEIKIAIENVWNQFGYDHGGDHTQDAQGFIDQVDAFDSPFVAMQFDIGNHWKYGATGDWIRQLGKRVVKLDIKGFSRETNKFTKIGEGDLDWADVRKALSEIGYNGWCAAEVGGGDLNRLKEVAANMDRVLGLG
ncbi:MAG: sugar phosphate isomerase/epimerase family protein [Verrucomicrobiota bacterium]